MDNCSFIEENCTESLWNELYNNKTIDEYVSSTDVCGEWEPAQHNLFQLCNIFFAAAFLIPRSYKQGMIILRVLLGAGFFIQAIWSGVHVCSWDIVIWSIVLSTLNTFHLFALMFKLIPPSLSPELTELYAKLFGPLKVSRKHFKELAREASLLTLDPGDAYAVEEVTNADERLSILLRGKLKVTCDNIHLHYISSYQFIDSPEWEAGHVSSDELFQVTITAEEESLYLCWPKLKLARVLRHRPILKVILSNLIGKDITQKLYWLNETVGLAGLMGGKDASGTGCEHFRRVMSRSLSADAVNTSTKGHVKSQAWKKSLVEKQQSSLLYSEDEASLVNMTQHEWWQPVVANQFLASSPFPPPLALAPATAVPSANNCGGVAALPPTPLTPTKPRKPREVKFEEFNV